MRLFVAVELAEHVKRTAHEAARDAQRRIGDMLRARWVESGQMHLTVRFIGHVHDDRAAAVLDALRTPLPIEPFEIALGAMGVFPTHGAPRVLWIGLTEGLPSLTAMHQEVTRRLQPLGLEPENRPYSAHLTLARVKDAPRGSAAAVRRAIEAVRVAPERMAATHATVFESRLSPRGPAYTALLEIPLSQRQASR